MASWTVYCGVVAIAIFLLRRLYLRVAHTASDHRSQLKPRNVSTSKERIDVAKAYQITPLADFDWQAKEPLKFRTFKPKYHLTMGISNLSLSELIEIDRNYLSRIKIRKQIIQDHHDTVIQASPASRTALNELYTWLTGSYLPTRFPSMFTLSPTHLLNLVTSESLPLQPPTDPIQTFELLGNNLDEDFVLLLPSSDGDQYELKGFVTCFPSGFNTKEKFGMTLRDIHTPVPGYKEKLETSMDRFFARLEVGRVVQRSNWAITTHGRLFAASGTHLYEGEEPEPEDIDTFLRCERQLLHRLPKSKALVFSFKTYLYPLSDIKNEGLGEDLAQAIDGLKEGSVPAMHFYKRGVVWGEAVKSYLRAE
ncbi:hypothetical protein LHYA1_G004188 [Lachnellula hyalina]|uniref:HRQ family protein 2 n=1 Tax=Lachnellula hyalina TaxID=1316788 RepID=A0A8H8U0K3_9HELO|nr:uncharacterized protein LHYA1_G004188 [Lachnellula hyalina]TVY27415.1 hypothetical protein LHYA1_G004188 [Lachnellula hyalina]